jgi:hypothetical protein
MEASMQKRQSIAAEMARNDYGTMAEPVPQSEVEREWAKLLDTADALDSTVGQIIGRIEKVTRPEPISGGEAKGELNPVCGTILGRNLNELNSRLRHSMTSLQSTIQRIEL